MKWTQNLRASGTYRDVVWGNNLYIAVGDGGLISTSSDGKTWNDGISGTKLNLYSVAYGDRFVAVGKDGIILTSKNGTQWNAPKAYIQDGLSFTSIAWNGQLYCAGGIKGKVMTSPDGEKWTPIVTNSGGEFRGMASTPDGFLAAASSGGVGLYEKGKWTTQKISSYNFYGCACDGKQYLVGGKDGSLYRSTNGSKWQQIDTGITSYFMSILAINGEFVACGDGNVPHPAYGKAMSFIGCSKTGEKWVRDLTPDYSTLLGLASNGKNIIAVGARKLIIQAKWEAVTEPNEPPIIISKIKKYRISKNGVPFLTLEGEDIKIEEIQ